MLGNLVEDIDAGTRHNWALKLASRVFDEDATFDESQLLGDLYASRGDQDWADVMDELKARGGMILDQDSGTSSLQELCQRMPELRDYVVDNAVSVFKAACTGTLGFILEFRKFITKQGESSVTSEECLKHLKIIQAVLLKSETLDWVSDELQTLLLDLQGSKDEKVAASASKAFALTGFSPDRAGDVWVRVCGLILDQSQPHTSLGHKLWLRWCSRTESIAHNQVFMDAVQTEQYWKFLLDGVTTDTHTNKKYCLHVLTQSLQLLEQDVDNRYMKWSVAKRGQQLVEWNRYITLVEIIAIDTSMNQTVDSMNDFLALLSDKSLIPSVWSIGLVHAGISQSMDTVRNFIVKTVMELDEQHLRVFGKDLSFMCDTYLPFTLNSHYFTITEHRGKYACEHSGRISSFMSRFMKVLEDDKLNEFMQRVCEFFAVKNTLFDVARIFAFIGLKNGLVGRHVLNSDTIARLGKLWKFHTESKLRTRALFVLTTDILLCARIDGSQDCDGWIFTLNSYLHNHYGFIDENLTRRIANFVREQGLVEQMMNSDALDLPIKVELIMELSNENKWSEVLNYEQKCEIINASLAKSSRYLCENTSKEFIKELRAKVHRTEQESIRVGEKVAKVQPIEWNWLACGGLKSGFDELASWLRATRLLCARNASVSGLWHLLAPRFSMPVSAELRPACESAQAESFKTLGYYSEHAEEYDFDINEVLKIAGEHFATSGYECRSAICYCLQMMLHRSDSYDPELMASMLDQMWLGLTEDRLALVERDLHLKFVDFAFDPSITNTSSEVLQNALEGLGYSVIDQTFGRRTIGPRMARALYKAECKPWIARVFARVYTFQQLNDVNFNSDFIIAEAFDKVLAEDGHKTPDSFLEFYQEYEVASRVFAFAYLSNMDDKTKARLFDAICTDEYYTSAWKGGQNANDNEYFRIQAFQMLLLTESALTEERALEALHDKLLPMIDSETSPMARAINEWMIAKILCRTPDQIESVLLAPMEDYEGPPRIVSSSIRMGLLVGRKLKKTTQVEESSQYFREFLSRVIALSTSNRAAVRHFAVSMLCAVDAQYENMTDEFKAYISDVLYVVKNTVHCATAAPNFRNFRSGDRMIWDLDQDFTLVGICGGVFQRLSDRNFPIIGKHTWERYLKGVATAVSIGDEDDEEWQRPMTKLEIRASNTMQDPSTALQTKSGIWNASVDVVSDDDHSGRVTRIKRGELIVLASLVDKPPNLGGICRLSDVLGAGLLCMDDMAVVKNTNFKTVAVTAERWMPMQEVKIDDIIAFMQQKKKEGYTLVGLEQTDTSVQLNNNLQFPKKSLLLLGREREGIPGNLLAELDFCVEIKQVGMIRSMNIQTATAVVCHAYSSQHC